MSQKAIFLDRDGTLIYDAHYLSQVSEIQWLPQVFEDLRQLSSWGYLLVLITNQSGIGRGYFSQADYEKVNEALRCQAEVENVIFSGVYHCPHWPEKDGPCLCRKPGTEMFEKAIKELGIDVSQSLAVGDRERDVLPAKKLGVKQSFVVPANEGLKEMMRNLIK